MHQSVVYTHIPVNPPYSGYIPSVNHQQSFSYGAFTAYYANCSVFVVVLNNVHVHKQVFTCICVF